MIRVDCPHWTALGTKGGTCAIGKPRKRDGSQAMRPSHGTCVKTCGVKLIEVPVEINAGKKTITMPTAGVPRDQWPAWANELAGRSIPADSGIGDVIARTLGKCGSVFKSAFKKLTGRDCGCGNRQAKLNAMYPLNVTDQGKTSVTSNA